MKYAGQESLSGKHSLWDRTMTQFGLSLAHLPARRLQFLLDLSIFAGSFIAAYLLRFEFAIPDIIIEDGLNYQLPLVLFVQFLAMLITGVYRFIWRYISLRDLHAFVYASIISAVFFLILRLGLPEQAQPFRIPISVICINALLAFPSVLTVRLLRRVLYERYEKRIHPGYETNKSQKKTTLLIGAGRAGVLAAGELAGRGNLKIHVVGFVDDDASKRNAVINGIRVLGTTDDLKTLVNTHQVEQVVITIARPTRQAMDQIIQKCDALGLKVRIIPGLFDILEGAVRTTRIRDVQIEDLLGRPPVKLDHDQLGGFLRGKVVMVTGAGGSIGSELVRQLARFSPTKILMVERSEPALFEIGRDMNHRDITTECLSVMADVTDENRMRQVFEAWRPHLVFHAAAHKHVPLMESNVGETIKNNVFGTQTLGRLAGEYRCQSFVLVSTDKAVNPTSIMGASKRVAELVTQDLNKQYTTRYLAVRFGNVLGSTGSVIPIFRDQIQRGGPVTVTHPDMKRYFMTIPEASQLVIQAGAMGQGGEIFILDMGKEVKIADLASKMISLSGFRPSEDIEIVFTGMRPGEKLYEELSTSGENISKTKHPKIYIGEFAPSSQAVLSEALNKFREDCREFNEAELREGLSKLLPESNLTLISKKKSRQDSKSSSPAIVSPTTSPSLPS